MKNLVLPYPEAKDLSFNRGRENHEKKESLFFTQGKFFATFVIATWFMVLSSNSWLILAIPSTIGFIVMAWKLSNNNFSLKENEVKINKNIDYLKANINIHKRLPTELEDKKQFIKTFSGKYEDADRAVYIEAYEDKVFDILILEEEKDFKDNTKKVKVAFIVE